MLFLLVIPGAGAAEEREKLRVSTLFIGSSLLPIWVAQERGMFARA
jgi:ABC-type nitrate/sulfonate/bicarbonate transport system substrate-binding protein